MPTAPATSTGRVRTPGAGGAVDGSDGTGRLDPELSELASVVETASVRELIAHLALCEDQLRHLRRMEGASGAPAAPGDAGAVERARDEVLHLQGSIVRELRRRRGRRI